MRLEDIGEKGLLDLIRDICDEGGAVQIGIGDDAAAIGLNEGSLVVTTDMLVEDVHFTSDIPPDKVGRKAVVVNLSDLAAMGAEPLGLVYSMGAPSSTEANFVSDLLEGMNSTVREHETYLVGGDLNEANEFIVSGTAFGKVESEEELLTRSGAKPGDFVGITGEIGAANVGVKALLEGYSLEGRDSLKKALFEPVARLKEGRILSESGRVNSAIDVTDGLASDLWQISRASAVGLVVEREKLPVNEAAQEFVEDFDLDLEDFILYGGEDFEILFTAEPEIWSRLEEDFQELGTKVSKIGRVEENEGVRIERDGETEDLPDLGYEHFSK